MEFFSKVAIFFDHGGEWMWVILMIQIASIVIAVERIYTLFIKRKMNQLALATEFESMIRQGQLAEALGKAEATVAINPLSRVIAAGIKAALNLGGKDEIQGKMDEILLEENSKIEKRTPFLAMFANVGTLTGLLGTIVGMITSFAAISEANPIEKATILSGGISEAMNCTAYGLIMAIPALVLFAILTNRANHLVEDLNQGALKVFNWLSYAYEPVPVRMARSSNKQNTSEVSAQV